MHNISIISMSSYPATRDQLEADRSFAVDCQNGLLKCILRLGVIVHDSWPSSPLRKETKDIKV